MLNKVILCAFALAFTADSIWAAAPAAHEAVEACKAKCPKGKPGRACKKACKKAAKQAAMHAAH